MHHPDDFAARRRAAAATRPAPDPEHGAPSPQLVETERMLERHREGDRSFEARRLLAIVRADRRPFDLETLTQAIDQVAADEGMSDAAVRDLLDTALQLEGSTFEVWKDDLAKRRPRIGRGAKPAQQLLQAVQSILFLLTLVGLCSAEVLSAAVSTSTAAVVAVRSGPRTAVSWTASGAQLVAAQRVLRRVHRSALRLQLAPAGIASPGALVARRASMGAAAAQLVAAPRHAFPPARTSHLASGQTTSLGRRASAQAWGSVRDGRGLSSFARRAQRDRALHNHELR